MERLETEVTNYKLKRISNMVIKGELRLPDFQRNYVWNLEKAAFLWDSIVKGIPINNLILWYSNTRLNAVRTFGDVVLKEPTNKVYYALDGQQRITTICGAYNGLVVEKVDFKELYINVSLDPNEYTIEKQVVTKKEIYLEDNMSYYNLHAALNPKLNPASVILEIGLDNFSNLMSYIDIIKEAALPISISSGDNPIVSAEIFSRTNTSGKALTPFEIMSAVIFDNDKKFYFNERINQLSIDLEEVGFKFPTNTLFKAVAVIVNGNVSNKSLLSLDTKEVIANWDDIHLSMLNAVDFLKLHFKIYTKKDLICLPHFYLLSRFFFLNKCVNPTYKQLKVLEEFIFLTGLSNYFVTTKRDYMVSDSKRILGMINNERQEFKDMLLPNNLEDFIVAGEFSKTIHRNSFNRAIIVALRMRDPKSYSNGMPIVADNLSQINSVHLHHIFPKAVYDLNTVNNIFNISVLDSETNQYIGVKNPSNYFPKYSENPNFKSILSTHFIGDLNEYGILSSNLELFIEKRAVSILSWISERIDYKLI